MEDVKEHIMIGLGFNFIGGGFNPCFNGRCKRTPPIAPLLKIAGLFQSLF